jgi:hypothetical protein
MLAGAGFTVAVLALAASAVALLGTFRQWQFTEYITTRESTPAAVLVNISGTWWWRLSNHGTRYINPIGIEWVDVDPAVTAIEPGSTPWGIAPGSEVFVLAAGNPQPGRTVNVTFAVVYFTWWRRRGGDMTQRSFVSTATTDPTVSLEKVEVGNPGRLNWRDGQWYPRHDPGLRLLALVAWQSGNGALRARRVPVACPI